MTYTLAAMDFCPADSNPTFGTNAAGRPGLLRRIVHMIFESRQRQADREIAHYLERTGGRLTDDLERRMTQHLMTGDWSIREE
jgi:hypothetical protein